MEKIRYLWMKCGIMDEDQGFITSIIGLFKYRENCILCFMKANNLDFGEKCLTIIYTSVHLECAVSLKGGNPVEDLLH
ncbi:Protein of unknown function [Gryllus bimaculatus]|nr:Protein of unknown function [Gryllus bimaculatus]